MELLMNKQCNIFGVQNQSEPDPLIKKSLKFIN